MHFHFALDLANYAASPAPALLPASGEQCLAEEGDSERQEVVSPGPVMPAGHGAERQHFPKYKAGRQELVSERHQASLLSEHAHSWEGNRL